jgi:hypothetical protein
MAAAAPLYLVPLSTEEQREQYEEEESSYSQGCASRQKQFPQRHVSRIAADVLPVVWVAGNENLGGQRGISMHTQHQPWAVPYTGLGFCGNGKLFYGDENKIFIGGLPRDSTTEMLHSYFSTFGVLLACDVITRGGHSRGFGMFQNRAQTCCNFSPTQLLSRHGLGGG